MTDKLHYEYKIITESSCPSTEELNKFFSSRKYSIWKDQYYYTYTLPSTKTLVSEAHNRLQEEISKYLNEGWKLQGSIFVSLKETKTYMHSSGKINSYDIISYSQALVKEESHEDYLKRKEGNTKEVPDQSELDEVKKLVLEIQAKLQTFISAEETS
jgi:hypothetical protein